jgi:hypothetical protein
LSFAGRMGLFRSDLRSKILVTEDLYLKKLVNIYKLFALNKQKAVKNLLIIGTRLVYSKKPTGPQDTETLLTEYGVNCSRIFIINNK